MELLHIIVLALIQGITEFLPISSSAHLILPAELLNWPDQGLAFDVAVHVGTLIAVMVYFRNDIFDIVGGWGKSLVTREATVESNLAWCIALATIPAALAGLAFDDFIESNLRSIAVIAATTIGFGLLLGWSDHHYSGKKTLAEMTFFLAVYIGCFQALALIPGTSRSGITITAALLIGFQRTEAARFSFLLSIPIILLSGGYKGLGLINEPNVDWMSIGLGVAISAISAYLCIHYFLSFINRIGMLPFVIYRLILGAILIGLVLIA